MEIIRKIDVHAHVSAHPTLTPRLLGTNLTYPSVDELIGLYDQLDIEYGVLLPIVNPTSMMFTSTNEDYKVIADGDSMYNTPPCYPIYIAGLVFKWLLNNGGLEAMKEYNEKKAKILYDFLDNSKLFKNGVKKEDRSMMNVTFVTGDADLDAKFVKEATLFLEP